MECPAEPHYNTLCHLSCKVANLMYQSVFSDTPVTSSLFKVHALYSISQYSKWRSKKSLQRLCN